MRQLVHFHKSSVCIATAVSVTFKNMFVIKIKTFDVYASLTMSVPRSMQRMVMVPRGRGMLTKMKNRKGVISGMLLVSV